MKVLITGSRGFVGTELAKQLKKKKGFIIKEFSRSLGNDITDFRQCKKAVEGIDAVVHCAAALNEAEQGKLMRKINVKGTENLVKASAQEKCKRFIHISSVAVYGDSHGKIVDEKTEWNPITLYEKTKTEAEKELEDYKKLIPITIIRPPLVYGANETFLELFKMVQKNWPIIGKGKQVWQMVSAKDLSAFIIFCLENEKTKHETIICAEEKKHSYNEIMQAIAKAMEKKKYKPLHLPVWFSYFLVWLLFLASIAKKKKTIIIPSHLKRLLRNREYDTGKMKKFGFETKHCFEKEMKLAFREFEKKDFLQ